MQPQTHYSLKAHHSFHFDIYCEYFTRVTDRHALTTALTWAQQNNQPVTLLGGGSNMVFTQSMQGLVVQIALQGIEVIAETTEYVTLRVAAGENWHGFVVWCLDHGYYGLENLSLIPGTTGAAPIQNIGAYGVEIAEYLTAIHVLDRNTHEQKCLDPSLCQFGYRSSQFKSEWKDQYAITAIDLTLDKQFNPKTGYGAIENELKRRNIDAPTAHDISNIVCHIRRQKLPDPDQIGNAGSFFMNPIITADTFATLQHHYPDLPHYPQANGDIKVAAGWLVEQCGWKGKRRGDVGVHQYQSIVLVNHGDGSGDALMALAAEIIDDVKKRFGITLHIEPNIY